MALISTNDELFLTTVERWIQSQGEIFATIRYSRAAGSKSFEFFTSFHSFSDRIRNLPEQTSVIVFRERQLPLRGVVGDDFINKCLSTIPDGTEFLIVETTKQTAGRHSWFHAEAGETHAELKDALEESRNQSVAAGPHPAWWNDSPDVLVALVPDQYRSLTPGIY